MLKKIILTGLFLFITLPCFTQGKYYYLAQWEWFTESPGSSYWRSPGGDCLGLIDLRSTPQMSKAGGAPEGYGFFAYDKPQVIPNAIYLGDNLNGPLQNKTLAQKAMRVKIDSNTVLDALWELLTDKADPKGLTAAKPLMPTKALNLELHLGGHSLVKSEKFDQNKHPFVLEVIQNDYRRIRKEDKARGSDNYKRALDALEGKYKINYREFIPKDLPDEGKLPHKTTITESFPTNQADLGGGNQDLSWTVAEGAISVTGGRAQDVDDARGSARAETDLSTDDHYAQANLYPGTAGGGYNYIGPVARFSSSATAFYAAQIRTRADSTFQLIRVAMGGAGTGLASTAGSFTSGSVGRIEVDGSTVTLLVDGVSKLTATDTNITGNLRTGIRFNMNQAQTAEMDNFQAGDLHLPAMINNALINNALIQ